MNRRSFLQRMVFGVTAAISLTAVGFDAFAKAHKLRTAIPFPVWTAKWKRFWVPGWKAVTRLNIPEGQLPPAQRSWNGQPYDRFSVNPTSLVVTYVAR